MPPKSYPKAQSITKGSKNNEGLNHLYDEKIKIWVFNTNMQDFERCEPNEDLDLKRVGLELMFLTPEKCANPDGISAVELSKSLGIEINIVKKKLKILFDHEIIRSIGINPKIWKFDEYKFQRMDEDDSVYRLLCSFDDVDFDRYFQY